MYSFYCLLSGSYLSITFFFFSRSLYKLLIMTEGKKTKIVFLDCDGVISAFGNSAFFAKDLMQRLKRIVQESGAKIVLSSAWRTSAFGRGQVTQHLVECGLPTFIDITPSFSNKSRTEEILYWLEENKQKYDIVNFVALDDIPLASMAPDPAFFVRHAVCTNPVVGLTDDDVKKALDCLSDNNNL